MTRQEFANAYEAWGSRSRVQAEAEAATVNVPGDTVIVVSFPLGDQREYTLRLVSEIPNFDESVVMY